MKNKIIPFNIPTIAGNELKYIKNVINKKISQDRKNFILLCQKWLEQHLSCMKVLLTSSCTASLEMAAILLNISPGDEVIMPSYTFVSTANAFVLRGATIVFVDIHPNNMNIDENLIETAITNKTRAIVVVHYAGVACEMDSIIQIAKKYQLWIIEDAAQGIMSSYKGKYLGVLGHLGCFSFHATKNYTAGGEGGALLINDMNLIQRAEVIYYKGTNYKKFLCEKIDHYSWQDIGSNYSISNLQAACLWAQLKVSEIINKKRLSLWNKYYNVFMHQNVFEVPYIPKTCLHNAHIFYLKVKNNACRQNFIKYMKLNNILITPHYTPLHNSLAGKRFSRFSGQDRYTTNESQRLVRLPLFYNLSNYDHQRIIHVILKYE